MSKPRTKNERLGKKPFEGFTTKGGEKPPGSGRKKGTPNKINKTARDIARAFVENRPIREIEKLFKEAGKKDPAAALCGYFAAMEFVTPKLARQETTGPDGGPQAIEVRHVTRTYAEPAPVEPTLPPEPPEED